MVFSSGKKLSWRVLLVATLITCMVGMVSGFNPSSENVHARFNETSGTTVYDFSGENLDGSLVGSGTNQGVTGFTNSSGDWGDGLAYEFNRDSNSYVTFPDNNKLEINNTGELTIAAWIKPSVTLDTTSNYRFKSVFDSADTSNNEGYELQYDEQNGELKATVGKGSGGFNGVKYTTTLSSGKWYFVAATYNKGQTELELFLNGNEVASSSSLSFGTGDSSKKTYIGEFADGSSRDFKGVIDEPHIYNKELNQTEIQNLYNYNCLSGCLNSAPSIDSVSTSPSSWTLGSDVNVSANVTDSDGNVSSVSADVFENGTQIVNDASLSDSDGDGTWNISNLFTVDESNVYYNVSLRATDNDGASSTKEVSQLIKNLPPKIAHLKPQNNSDVFTYNPEYKIRIRDDGDNVPGENITCDLYSNANQFSTVSALENESQAERTFNGSLSEDVGSNEFKTSCVDGTTTNTTTNYQTKYSEIQNVYGASPVYETENRTFELDLKTGDMVNQVDFSLNYSGDVKDTESLSSNGVETLQTFLYHEVPLVNSNQTTKNWKINYNLNISDFQNTTTSIVKKNTSTQTQKIYWSYNLENQSLTQSKYAAGSDIKYKAYISNKTSKGSVSGEVKNSQKDTYYKLETKRVKNSVYKYSQVTPTNYINQSSLTVDVTPDYEVSFNGDTRDFNENSITTTLEKFDFGLCSNINGEKALQFKTYNEKNRSQRLKSNLNFAAFFWNPDHPDVKKTANFSSTSKKTHNLCITPGYATAKVDSTEKLIQYTDPQDDYVLRSYFLINETVDNSTTEVPLYMLSKNQSSRVRFTVQNENREELSDVVIRIQRYFPSIDKLLTTAMVKTGAQGETETFIEVNEIYYAFDLYRDKKLVKNVPQQVIPSDLTLTFTVGSNDVPDWYDYNDKVSSDCSYNATRVTCEYSSSTEALENVTLSVYRNEMIGQSVYNTSVGRTASGTLTVKGFNASKHQYNYELIAYFSNDNSDFLEGSTIGDLAKPLGGTGVMISLFLFLAMSFAGLWKPSASIALGTFSIIISWFLPFLTLTQTSLTALVALAAVLVWRMN